MKEKKNIDRIFQEKFKDFEVNPDEKVWENISRKLDEKKKRRAFIIPLWFKIGGVAAVIAIIIAGLLFTNNRPQGSSEPNIVFDKPENIQKEDPNSNPSQSNTNTRENEGLAAEENTSSENEKTSITGSDSSSSSNNSVASQVPESNKISGDKARNKKNAVPSKESGLTSLEENNTHDNSEYEKEELAKKPEVISKDPSGIIAGNEADTLKNIITEPENTFEEENALAQIEKEKLKNKESEDEETSESKSRKLELSTFAAPVFYKNMGSGNELSSQFSNNSASTDVTVSYGVKVAYEVFNKVKIRTGISKINMSYNIQDISYSPMAMANSFENIRPSSENISVRSDRNMNSGYAENTFVSNSLSSAIFTPGEINQQFGFIEVPLEIEYALVDKKLGLNLIGGASGLFLDKNRVDLNSGNTTTVLGEASNINSTSFSTNIGVGLDYELSDKFSLNLEPIFKYQLNTFNSVENVQPVNFGIYSGISIKF